MRIDGCERGVDDFELHVRVARAQQGLEDARETERRRRISDRSRFAEYENPAGSIRFGWIEHNKLGGLGEGARNKSPGESLVLDPQTRVDGAMAHEESRLVSKANQAQNQLDESDSHQGHQQRRAKAKPAPSALERVRAPRRRLDPVLPPGWGRRRYRMRWGLLHRYPKRILDPVNAAQRLDLCTKRFTGRGF